MTRTGKIARLPRDVRETLNERLCDGATGRKLVAWLNGMESVQEVLAEQFDGRPLNEQNLSEWKQGGYRDWLRQQERLDLVARLAEETEEIEEEANGLPVSHLLASSLAAELARTAETVLQETVDPMERFRQLRRLLHELTELRREDRKAMRALRDMKIWAQEDERKAERAEREALAKARAPVLAALKVGGLAEVFGGGKAGWQAAAYLTELEYDLPFKHLIDHPPPRFQNPAPGEPNQTRSNQIKSEPGLKESDTRIPDGGLPMAQGEEGREPKRPQSTSQPDACEPRLPNRS